MRTFIVWSDDPLTGYESPIGLIGSKALGLHQLRQVGARVPEWATISSDLFRAICESDQELGALLGAQSDNCLEKAFALRNHIKHMRFDAQNADLLRAVWARVSSNGALAVSVRSSALHEDSAALSFAGQMDTFLNIKTEKAFFEAVIGCWMSLFGEKAVLNSISCERNPWACALAVLVQQMVRSEVSGVLFSANTATGNPKEMIINGTWGLGEGVVSGLLDVDTFIVNAHGQVVKEEVALKRQRVGCNENGATQYEEVEPDKQAIASLNNEQIALLHAMALKVQAFKNTPMEIEFALAHDTLYLLQARPIARYKAEGVHHDNFKLWDNALIAESFSGITTPLTFSFIKKVYYARSWQFCEALGAGSATIRAQSHLFETMLGLIEGRVYCNLLDLYRTIAVAPGFRYARRLIEQIAGLEKIGELGLIEPPKSSFEKYAVHLPRFCACLGKIFLTHILLADMLIESRARYALVSAQMKAEEFALLTPAQLLARYRLIENEIFWKGEPFVANDIEARLFYWMLTYLSQRWGIDKDGSLQNDLLRSTNTITATKAIVELYRLAQLIHLDHELESLFLKRNAQEALDLLRSDPRCVAINKELEKYQAEFLGGSADGMKLEAPLQRENPLFCVNVMQHYLKNKIADPLHTQMEKVNALLKSERELKETLARTSGPLFLFRNLLYQWALKNCRNALAVKEDYYFARAQTFGLVSSLMKAIGAQWEQKAIIGGARDIFYLEIDEIRSYIEGSSTCLNLKELIRLRKEEFRSFQEAAPDDSLQTHGEVYYRNTFAQASHPRQVSILKGEGCCRGTAEKRVQVVRMPDTNVLLQGEIVVAEYLDPGWTVLLPAVGGLIIEKADMLSHCAILAREMGIPAVVGVKHATKLLHTGDTVLLNATQGTVTILKRVDG